MTRKTVDKKSKSCTGCHKTKPINEFYVRRDGHGDGHVCRCKSCNRVLKKRYIQKNRDKINEQARNGYHRNKDKISKRYAQYYQDNRDYMLRRSKAWRIKNHKKCLERDRAYRQTHSETVKLRCKSWKDRNGEYIKTWRNDYLKKRWRDSPVYRVRILLRNRHRRAVKMRGISGKRAFDLLGCTIRQYVLYIESKFYLGMSWGNMGLCPGSWQIDHIIPVAMFDLTDPKQQRKCFHYTNMQPLWWKDHQTKTKIDMKRIQSRK